MTQEELARREAERRRGRLVCTGCGADLGSADDPYRDPDCRRCHELEELEGEDV